jgi:hypothetical protein
LPPAQLQRVSPYVQFWNPVQLSPVVGAVPGQMLQFQLPLKHVQDPPVYGQNKKPLPPPPAPPAPQLSPLAGGLVGQLGFGGAQNQFPP